MTNEHMVSRRLINQRIAAKKFAQPEMVVRWMGAMQAQDYTQAIWAIGLRTQSATLVDVEQAIAEGKILRTWPMRGTIHFVPARDAKWMLMLSARRTIASDRRRQEQLDLDLPLLERCKQLLYDALHGGRRLSRPDVMSLLKNAGISTENQRGYHILVYAALSGLICLGPMQDRQQSFVLLDEWVPDAHVLSREEALAELAARYFTSHGPATLRDFAWWAGLTLTDARSGLAASHKSLTSVTINAVDYWFADQASLDERESEDVHLLPGFDEYLLGYTDRSAMLASEHASKIVPGGNGVFKPMLVLDGYIVGGWMRSLKKNRLEITINQFAGPVAPRERLIAAAERYSAFLGLPLSGVTINAPD